MVPKCTSDEHLQSNLNPKGKQFSARTRFSTLLSSRKENVITSFSEKPLAEELSKKVVFLISNVRR